MASSIAKSSTIQQSSGKRLMNTIFGTYSTKIKNDSSKDIYVILSESEVTVIATRNIHATLGNTIASASAGLKVESTYQGAKKQETIIPSSDFKIFDIDHDYYLTIMTLHNEIWMIHERNRYIRKHKNFSVSEKKTKYVIDNLPSNIREFNQHSENDSDMYISPIRRDIGINTDPEDYYAIAVEYADDMSRNMCNFSCDCDCGVFRSSLIV